MNSTYIQNGTLEIEIDGLTPGSQHDQVIVNGAVTFNGLLDLTFSSFTPANGDMIFILLNDGVDPIAGTFTGLAQGGVFATWQKALGVRLHWFESSRKRHAKNLAVHPEIRFLCVIDV